MIAEDYCSFEVAKLLKKKGFDESVSMVYMSYGDLCKLHRYNSIRNSNYNDITKNYFECTAPTLQMVCKWFREVHKISIEITSTGYLIDNDVEWECDIKAGHKLYFKHITNEKSFESCAEAAIKYCLENLI